jgi:hypothetical protein
MLEAAERFDAARKSRQSPTRSQSRNAPAAIQEVIEVRHVIAYQSSNLYEDWTRSFSSPSSQSLNGDVQVVRGLAGI